MKRSTFITWDQLKVGGIILVALAIMTLAVFKLGQAANLWARRYELVTLLPSVNGLRVGGSVLIAGQLAGTVKSIDLLPVDYDSTRNVSVVMTVDRAMQEQVRSDSRVQLRTMGLLGDKVLDIRPGSPRYSVLSDGDTVTASPSLDYEQILAQAAGAVGDVVALTRDLKVLTGAIVAGEGTIGQLVTNRRLYDGLTGTLARMNAVLTRFQNPNGSIGRLLDDPSLYNTLTSAVRSADALVVALGDRKGTMGRLLHDDSLYTQLVSIARGADSVMRLVTAGNGLAARVLTDQTLYDNLNKLVTDMSALVADVRRDPRRYTKGVIKVF